MKTEIFALLSTKFAGVRKDGLLNLARILSLQATTPEEAKTLVEKINKAQVDEYVKEFRADVDKEMSESNKTFKANLEKKYNLVEKVAKPGADPDDANDIAAMISKAVSEAVTPLQTELASYKESSMTKTRLQSVTEKLAGCNDSVFKERELKNFGIFGSKLTDEQYTEYLAGLDTDISSANQNVANTALSSHAAPWRSNGDMNEEDSFVQAMKDISSSKEK